MFSTKGVKPPKWTIATSQQIVNFFVFYLLFAWAIGGLDIFLPAANVHAAANFFGAAIGPLLIYTMVYLSVTYWLTRRKEKRANAPKEIERERAQRTSRLKVALGTDAPKEIESEREPNGKSSTLYEIPMFQKIAPNGEREVFVVNEEGLELLRNIYKSDPDGELGKTLRPLFEKSEQTGSL